MRAVDRLGHWAESLDAIVVAVAVAVVLPLLLRTYVRTSA